MDALVSSLPDPPTDADHAAQVAYWHSLALRSAPEAIEAAARCGRVLLEKKDLCRQNGIGFKAWCESLPNVSDMTCTRYMKLATNWDKVTRVLPSDASINEALRYLKNTNVRTLHTGREEWFTPPKYLVAARRVMGNIDLDPASCEYAQRTVRAARYFTLADDGLSQPWSGRVWMNPPFTAAPFKRFANKLADEFETGRVSEAIALTGNNTDAAAWHRLAGTASALCFTRGRIAFYRADGEDAAPTNGHCLHYLGPNVPAFEKEFAEFGLLMNPSLLREVEHETDA